ncbi:hypothetical protein A4S06_02480 [Erysipelotrichaceae bacterium MTC7]|nr:hypothetical protein A4S06_02480 [Erysipelotrichaceae bacterium MTC7]
MRKSTYVKEHLYVLLFGILLSALQVFFMIASGVNVDTIVFFMVSLWLFILAFLVIEYRRKQNFYHNVQQQLERLDQKSLLHEVLEVPSFEEGQIFYQTLEVVNKDYNDRLAQYAKREADYKEYVEMWIHEIKSPLTAAKLMNTNHPSLISKELAIEMDRMDDYIEQALYYAKSSDPQQDYVLKDMNLSDSVNAAVRRLKQRFIAKHIKLTIQDCDCKITMDSKWLEFILHQILDNALKYTNDYGKIEIYAKKHEEHIEVSIRDHGIGIDPKDLPRIYNRGFTGENGRLEKKATGMGLYLCKALCDKLYIQLQVDSQLGKGTSVTLSIPNTRFYKQLVS